MSSATLLETRRDFVGYARISTDDQTLSLQRDALKAAGCHKIFEDRISGSKSERPGLTAALDYLRPGDSLVVWRLDRLGRSVLHLVSLSQRLRDLDVNLVSVREHIDTNTPIGKYFFTTMAALAEFERDLIRERTRAGLDAARARGRRGGRKALSRETQAAIKALMRDPNISPTDIAAQLQIHRSTVYRYRDKP